MIWLLAISWMLTGLVSWCWHLAWLSMWLAVRASLESNCKTIYETRRFMRLAAGFVVFTLLSSLVIGPLTMPVCDWLRRDVA